MQSFFEYTFEIVPPVIVYLSFFFTTILLSSKSKKIHKLLLASLTALIGLNFLNVILITTNLISQQWNLGVFFGFLYGPLIYLFVVSMMYELNSKLSNLKIHFLPSIIILAGLIPFHQFIYNFIYKTYHLPVIIHIGFYLYLSLKEIKHYHRELENNYSSVHSYRLDWVKNLIVIFLVVLIFLLLESTLQSVDDYMRSTFVFLSVLVLISYLYYKSINSSFLLITKKEKYGGNSLSQEEIDSLYEQLKSVIDKKKLFLNEKLSLEDLSLELGEKNYKISRVINEKAGRNFYEFINSYRVQHAKKLLLDPNNQRDRIGEIMFDSGFNSKSTFNSVFKKETGLTPSKYRQKKSANI